MQRKAVLLEPEPALLRDEALEPFDLRMEKLLDPPAVEAEKMVVMLALLEFEDGTRSVDVGAPQQPGLLELKEDTVHGSQTERDVFGAQCLHDIFGAHVPHPPRLKGRKDPLAGQRGLQTHAFELFVRWHVQAPEVLRIILAP
jgi:hypothetical protein